MDKEPAQHDIEDTLELTEEAREEDFHFESDFRVTNPGLHRLHVKWAREDIRIARQAAEALWNQSRVSTAIIAENLWQSVKKTICRDAAWFEAAALEFMNPGHDIPVDDRIYAGEFLMKYLPPGKDLEGYITQKDGKFVFELIHQDESIEDAP